MMLRAREAALRPSTSLRAPSRKPRGDTLFTMRSMIDRFTLDNQRPPSSLEEMVEAGYLADVPIDPFTRSSRTWLVETDDFLQSSETSVLGVVNIHSGSDQISLEGTPYNSW